MSGGGEGWIKNVGPDGEVTGRTSVSVRILQSTMSTLSQGLKCFKALKAPGKSGTYGQMLAEFAVELQVACNFPRFGLGGLVGNTSRMIETSPPRFLRGDYRFTGTLATGFGGFEGRSGYMLHRQEWVTGRRQSMQIFSFYLRVLSMNLVRSASKK